MMSLPSLSQWIKMGQGPVIHFTSWHQEEYTEVFQTSIQLEMWASAQRDGRPAEHRWRPLFNAAKFG